MKNPFLLFFIAATSFLMSSCLKDIDVVTKTTYTGCIVEKGTNNPIVNRRVLICNTSATIFESTTTNEQGRFSLTLDYAACYGEEIYLCYSGGVPHSPVYSSSYYYILQLTGIGREKYDYGILEVEL